MIVSGTAARNKIITMTAVLALASLVAPSSAHANSRAQARGPSSIACVGTAKVDYTPGLTFTRSQVAGNVDYRYSLCMVVNQPGVRSGGFQWLKNQMESCEDLRVGQPPYSYDMPIFWNDNTSSVATVTVVRDPKLPGVAFRLTGTVNAGHFTGNNLTMRIAFLNTPSDLSACNSPGGLTSLSGVLSLALTPPAR